MNSGVGSVAGLDADWVEFATSVFPGAVWDHDCPDLTWTGAPSGACASAVPEATSKATEAVPMTAGGPDHLESLICMSFPSGMDCSRCITCAKASPGSVVTA